MLDQVVECGHQGMGIAEMAVEIGVSRETFNRWRHENPEFRDAIKAALVASQAWWERNGRAGTFGETEGFNATSYIFQMKNRFPDDWRDKKQHEMTGADGGPIETRTVSSMSDALESLPQEDRDALREIIKRNAEQEG